MLDASLLNQRKAERMNEHSEPRTALGKKRPLREEAAAQELRGGEVERSRAAPGLCLPKRLLGRPN